MPAPAAIASHRFVVLKFGGTSVAAKPRWDNIVELVRARRREGLRVVVMTITPKNM